MSANEFPSGPAGPAGPAGPRATPEPPPESMPPADTDSSEPEGRQRRWRRPGQLRTLQPQQSAIRLRRRPIPPRSDAGDATGAAQPSAQNVRSMLDVDEPPPAGENPQPNPQPIRLRRRSVGHTDANPPPPTVRSMLDVDDNVGPNGGTDAHDFGQSEPVRPAADGGGRLRRLSRLNIMGDRTDGSNAAKRQSAASQNDEYDERLVDMLDVVDPEVSTLSSLTNVQNSLFVPSLGRWVNRRPTFNLSRLPQMHAGLPADRDVGNADRMTRIATPEGDRPTTSRPGTPSGLPVAAQPIPEEDEQAAEQSDGQAQEPAGRPSIERIPSHMTDRFYAVRPQNTSLAHWSDEDLEELNDHVRHMLHSKRSALKRRMKAFGQYVSTPLGFLVTFYALSITAFGLAWVLFLIGWAYAGSSERQGYLIEVIDQVLVALFAIVGDGLIPWRIVDTYHMCYIARYHHLTWKLRQKMHVPDLKDKNDLPEQPVVSRRAEQEDLEAARNLHLQHNTEQSVLTPHQQKRLEHHQACFSKSHTFYKPHETETHHAFPLRFLVAIVVLLDWHSIFQLALGLTTWIIPRERRPGGATAAILCCSITVNITAGVLISIGDRKTRKKEVVERMFRQELTEEAMRRVQEKKEKQAKREEEEKNRLEKIDEEGGKSRSSNDFGFLRQNLLSRKESDESRKKASGSRKSMERSRKSLDRAGKFDHTIGDRTGEKRYNDPDAATSSSTLQESTSQEPSVKESDRKD